MNVPYGERFLPKRTFALAGKRKTPPTVSNQPNVGGFLKKSDENHMKINFHQLVSAVGSKKDKIAAGLLVLYAQAASAGDVQAFDKLYTQLTGWAQGSLGKSIAIIFLLVGLAVGLAKGSLYAAVVSIACGLTLMIAPSVIDSICLMAAPEGVRVPTGLDDPPRFLFFDADLVAVVLTVTYLGAVLDHIGAGVFLGALSAYGWHKVSGLHGRGYGAALAYWHLGASSFGRTPPSSARHFVR